MQALKENCSLLSRLYIAGQTRDGNLGVYFTYENQPWPPSISELGQLPGGQKADLLKCLPDATSKDPSRLAADAAVLNGAFIGQVLKPRTVRTFDEYNENIFKPYVLNHLKKKPS